MKTVILGAGRVSGEHIRAYLACGIDVVAVCGRTKKSAAFKIKELGLSAKPYCNFERMLDIEKPDMLSICSPPELHSTHGIAAAERGINIAIEKPVALSKEELFAMHMAIKKSGVKTIISFVLRWNDLMQNIRQKYLRNLGEVFYLEADYWHGSSHGKEHANHEYGTRKAPIGAFIGGGCHAVDMARFMLNSDVVELTAFAPRAERKPLQRTTASLVKFANGVVGKISATDEVFMPYIFNVHIFGTDGSIRLNKFYARNSNQKSFETIPGIIPDSGAVWHHPFRGMIQEFVDCIKKNKETSCNFEHTMNTHLACFAAEESAENGGDKIILKESY